MAEHVRFHMTSVPVSGSSEFSLFSYREEGSEREREERDGEREPRRGLYARAGLAGTSRPRLLSASPPISARQRSEGPRPGGGAALPGERRGLGTLQPDRGRS